MVSPTRREVLGAAAAGLLARGAAAQAATQQTDSSILLGLLSIETMMALVYRSAMQSGVVSAGTERLLGEVLAHEHSHAGALVGSLKATGVLQPVPRTPALASLFIAAHLPGGATSPHKEADWLRVLITAEEIAEGAYYKAIGSLKRAAALDLAVQIMSSEAQHAALIGEHFYHDVTQAVGYAFVQGSH